MTRLRPNEPCWCGSGKKYKKCHMHRDRIAGLQQQSRGLRTPERPVKPGTVSPMRPVPEAIPPTPYAASGAPERGVGFSILREDDELARMRQACRAARRVLAKTCAAVAPGVTTEELDAIAHQAYIDEGGYPSTLNYHGYRKSICTSINEVICHGIPDSRPLEDGDIVNIDVTIYRDGFHGDCSQMALVGTVDEASRQLVAITEQAMYAGIAAARAGVRLREVGRAIDATVAPHGYGVVRAFVGHGIGRHFHMDPQVAHYYDANATTVLEPGMTFTIEPMINLGTWQHRLWDDNWTAVTADLQRSAQHERTILITEHGPEVLTVLDEDEATRFLE